MLNRRMSRLLLGGALLLGCGRAVKPPASAAESASTVLEMARARPTADPVRARFNIKISSPSLHVAGATGAAMLVARPMGRVDVLGPLGNSLVTFATNGVRADVVSTRDRAYLYANAAEESIREVTGGVAGIGDIAAVLVGDLPLDTAPARRLEVLGDGMVHVTLDGPGKTGLDAILDPALGTPERLEARNTKGTVLLVVEYGEFAPLAEGGPLVPDSLALFLPALDLTLELTFKKWEVPESVDVALFEPTVPEGFTSKALEEAILEAVGKVGDASDAAPEPGTDGAP